MKYDSLRRFPEPEELVKYVVRITERGEAPKSVGSELVGGG